MINLKNLLKIARSINNDKFRLKDCLFVWVFKQPKNEPSSLVYNLETIFFNYDDEFQDLENRILKENNNNVEFVIFEVMK